MRSISIVRAGCCLVGLAIASASCTFDEVEDEDESEYIDPGFDNTDGKVDGTTSVDAATRVSCSTVPVRGLSLQIAEELRCMAPGILVPFAETSRIKFASAAVLPYLAAETAQALQAAAPEIGTVTINSGLRALPQQFLLHRWKQQGRCNIRAAATPGRSNHETGRALDLANAAQARAAMRRRGFSTIANDPPHFDHLASPDLRGVGVEAFQRLWNRNHPEDRIAEDGIYGPQTAARLAKSPSGGFRAAGCAP
jgi:hypothetical protein